MKRVQFVVFMLLLLGAGALGFVMLDEYQSRAQAVPPLQDDLQTLKGIIKEQDALIKTQDELIKTQGELIQMQYETINILNGINAALQEEVNRLSGVRTPAKCSSFYYEPNCLETR